MVGFRRQRHDEIEIEAFEVFELLEGDRPVLGDIETHLLHCGHCEGIELAFAHAGRSDIGDASEQVLEQGRRHRRTHRIEPAGEQHGLRTVAGHALTLSSAGR